MVVDAGHEIGSHGYSHENPVAMTPQQERDVLEKCLELIENVAGRKPVGNVAPWWEVSATTNELLLEYDYKYDHSLQHRDFTPYYARVGDSWTKIDYSKTAEEWMKPLVRGEEIDLVKIGGNWYLDDLPPMMFIKGSPNSHGFVNPRDIEELWRDQFDWVYREMDYATYCLTIHPDVSRPAAGLADAREADRLHQRPRRHTLGDDGGDRRRLRPALPEVPAEPRPWHQHVRHRDPGRGTGLLLGDLLYVRPLRTGFRRSGPLDRPAPREPGAGCRARLPTRSRSRATGAGTADTGWS